MQASISEINWHELAAGRTYHPSPSSWQDEVLYFLLLDRFSDGREGGGFADLAGQPVGNSAERPTPLFRYPQDSRSADHNTWFAAGKQWCGGNFRGLRDKLGYLKRLGVTCVWISPVFRQVEGSQEDYHGYGIQNFLDVDPHFGTREELRDLVAHAHQHGIRVILDIILNHAGDVFAYQDDQSYYYYEGRQWPVRGYRRNSSDSGSLAFSEGVASTLLEGVWPREFQAPDVWTRRGEIRNWDARPEFFDGDFGRKKDICHGTLDGDKSDADLIGRIRRFKPGPALRHLADVYKFWMGYADLDGYRIDTVKHMEPGAVRIFVNEIRDYAKNVLGKHNYCLVGEITGGRQYAKDVVEVTGLTAGLGLGEVQQMMEELVKGRHSPGEPEGSSVRGFFDLFSDGVALLLASHQELGERMVTMFDDHDQADGRQKSRFCGEPGAYKLLRNALGLNLTTLGIPCIYYGTEQGFDGRDNRSGNTDYGDVYLRECMHGGAFGGLQSSGKHFFNETHEVFQFVSKLCALRKREPALRGGRQYLREVSASGAPGDFHYPQPLMGELKWVVAWSRLVLDREIVCAMNTDTEQELSVWVTVDNALSQDGQRFRCLLSTHSEMEGEQSRVEARNGKAIRIRVPAAGFVVFGPA
jgi:glycosidase